MKGLVSTIKITLLLAFLTSILVGVGYYFDGINGISAAILFSLVFNFIAFWFSDKIVLAMSGARPLSVQEAPALYQETEELSKSMSILTPRLYITNDLQPNAFATGRNQSNSVVCVTAGLLQALEPNEIRAVIAHELGHIKNYDVLITTVVAVIAGAISGLARTILYFTPLRSSRNDSQGHNIGDLIILITAPLAALLIQLAISRSREYSADAISAKYTNSPESLISALIKIDDQARKKKLDVNPALASLYISNPFKGSPLMDIFSTHPSLEKRIRYLTSLK